MAMMVWDEVGLGEGHIDPFPWLISSDVGQGCAYLLVRLRRLKGSRMGDWECYCDGE